MVSRTARTVTAVSATVILSLLATACGSDEPPAQSDPDGPVSLTFVAYGGAGQQAMIDKWQTPYTAAHPNVTFVNTSPPDVAQVKAQVESGQVEWDVVATSPAAAAQNCGTLFEPLDFPGLDTKELVEQAVGKCYIANFINATPFAYRTDAFPDPSKAPRTIADFFDVARFPGQRGILTNLQNGILEYPLLADGVAPDKLYPLDMDRALKKLDSIRKVTTFAPNVGALQQAVGAKQVDLFLAPDSRLVPLMDSGTDVTVVWDVTVTSINAFAVPKGSRNVKAATSFVASVVSPEATAGIAEALGVAPVNLGAKPNLSANAKKVEVYGPVNTGKTVLQDVDWYATNFNEATTKVTNWLAG
ncbi:extracellular solute-binding protein [Rhizomonospora bruguierae]|uniref:extracellular solute-binding protein n=1 Tax=Rhizomonospora bruguierae TaxID=1581705 RepID=UPI001BCFD143|nr:extracellular solute-binding protein [Micromonospora sp. NBRC 107566]